MSRRRCGRSACVDAAVRLDRVPCKVFSVTALVVLVSLAISGCDNNYSDAIRYLVRTDPLVMVPPAELNPQRPERPEPDRPGQLPLFAVKDLLELPNPFYQNSAELEKDNLVTSDKLRDPNLLSNDSRKELQQELNKYFGKGPKRPRVDGIDAEATEKLGLSREELQKGSELYRVHCLHCHGVTGNGRGPTSRWVNPHPRDFRQGLFKFQSVDQASDGKTRKPSRNDLMRTLQQGIEGTAMPSFNLLRSEDLEHLVSYVIHLSIRGEAEFETLKNAYAYNEKKLVKKSEPTPSDFLEEYVPKLGKAWLEAQTKVISVPPYPYKNGDAAAMADSVKRGQALFLADDAMLKRLFPQAKDQKELDKLKGASCVACHKDYGRQANFKFDSWGTLVRPANLTRAVYRGGRRPVDLYHRIHSGINGSGMAQFGGVLSNEQVWDLVNFVRLLPYPGMLSRDYKVDIR